jgi:hypothetical protein
MRSSRATRLWTAPTWPTADGGKTLPPLDAAHAARSLCTSSCRQRRMKETVQPSFRSCDRWILPSQAVPPERQDSCPGTAVHSWRDSGSTPPHKPGHIADVHGAIAVHVIHKERMSPPGCHSRVVRDQHELLVRRKKHRAREQVESPPDRQSGEVAAPVVRGKSS